VSVSQCQLDDNIRIWLLDEERFKSASKTRKCRRRNNVFRQSIPDPRSGNVEGPTTDCRQWEHRHHQATGAGIAECPPTLQLCYSVEWFKIPRCVVYCDSVDSRNDIWVSLPKSTSLKLGLYVRELYCGVRQVQHLRSDLAADKFSVRRPVSCRLVIETRTSWDQGQDRDQRVRDRDQDRDRDQKISHETETKNYETKTETSPVKSIAYEGNTNRYVLFFLLRTQGEWWTGNGFCI